MADFPEPIGNGGMWVKEGKKGKFLSGQATFTYNNHPITINFVAFKNDKAEGNRPQYSIKVNDAKPAEARKPKPPAPKDEPREDLPF